LGITFLTEVEGLLVVVQLEQLSPNVQILTKDNWLRLVRLRLETLGLRNELNQGLNEWVLYESFGQVLWASRSFMRNLIFPFFQSRKG
jgi:hypothetical protein